MVTPIGMHPLDLAPIWERLLAGLAGAALTWTVALDYGCALLSRVLRPGSALARLGIGGSLGYALIGTAVALLGVVRAINSSTLIGFLTFALLVRMPYHLKKLRRSRERRDAAQGVFIHMAWLTVATTCVTVAAILTALVNAALPTVAWDPIAYHLPIVAGALHTGSLGFDPGMVQTAFPLLGEAAALPAFAIAGSAGAAMTTLGAGLCVIALVSVFSERLRAGSGHLAAMLAASSALWAWLASTLYVDVPFALFVLATILTLGEMGEPAANNLSIALVAGMLAGAAAAVKYTGLGTALIVLAFGFASLQTQRLKAALAYCAGLALLAAPWYVRTFLLTRDPLYPFLSANLVTSSSIAFANRYISMTKHWCGGGASILDFLIMPYRLVADPRSFCGDPGIALRAGVVFAIVAVLVIPSSRRIAAYAVALTLLWFATSQQWRFLVPAAMLYCTLIAAGTKALSERFAAISGAVLVGLGAITVASNWIMIPVQAASASVVPAFAYMRGALSASDYLDARLESFAAARWFAAKNIAGDRIIALDDVRDYYFPRGTRWGNPYYQSNIDVDWGAPPEQRYEQLIAHGARYLVVNEHPAYVHRTPTGIDWAALRADAQLRLRPVFNAHQVVIYDLGVRR